MKNPLQRQTVTLYRRSGDGVLRQVMENCFYSWQDCLAEEETGHRFERKCLLVAAGQILPGDRVMEGVGPEQVDWESFVPVNVPALSEIAYVSPKYLGDKLHHYEAGR